MGFLGRFGKGLGGVFDALEAPAQFGWDVLRTFADDDFRRDGFAATLWGSFVNRAGQAASGVMGEQGLTGSWAGAIPEPIRRGPAVVLGLNADARNVDRPGFGLEEAFGGGALGFLESVGREFIREPISTAMTAASLADRPGGGGLGGLFDTDKWKRAHEIAQTRSMGQAITLAVMTKDILDEDELIKAQASPFYGMFSGSWDLAARIFLEPDNVIGGFAIDTHRAARSRRLAVAAEREAEAIRTLGRHAKARNRALGLTDEFADDAAATATDQLAARRRLEVRPRAVDEVVDPDDIDTLLGPDPADPINMPTGMDGAAGDIINAALDGDDTVLREALGTALRGDPGPLYRWASANGLNLSKTEVAAYLDNPAEGAQALALRVAEAKGFHNVDVFDADGNIVDAFDLGNFDESLEKAVQKARKKYGAGTYQEALTTAQFVQARFAALRAGGWDELLAIDRGRVDTMSRNLKYARQQFIQSPQWKRKLLPWMAGLDEIPLAQRIEIIRDRLFHQSADGDNLATWFALARSESERTTLMRFAMGDLRAINDLADAGMRRDIERLAKRRFMVRHFPNDGIMHSVIEEFELLNNVDDLAGNTKFAEVVDAWGRADSLGDTQSVIDDIEFYIRGGESPQQKAYAAKVAEREAAEAAAEVGGPARAFDVDAVPAATDASGIESGLFMEGFNRDLPAGTGVVKGGDGGSFVYGYRDENGDLIGYLDIFDDGTGPAVNGIYVTPDARGQGISTELWRAASEDGLGPSVVGSGGMTEAGRGARKAAIRDQDGLEADRIVAEFERRKLGETGAASLDEIGPRRTGSPEPSVSDAEIELRRLMMIATQDPHVMRMTKAGAVRELVHTNQIVEKVWFSKHNKLRVVFDMVAQPFLTPNDPMVAGKLKRHLRDAGFSDQEQLEWLGKFAAVRYDDNQRQLLLQEIADASMSKLADKHGVELDVARQMAEKVAEAQASASKLLSKNVRYGGYDPKTGKTFSWFEVTDINGDTTHMFLPLTPEQLVNAHVMPNYREIDKALRRVAGWKKYGYQGKDLLTAVPTAAAEAITKAWKPAVLLRPAWPMRVVFDEQVRMISVMGLMERLSTMKASGRELKMNLLRDMFGKVDKDKNVLFLSVDEQGRMLAPSPYNAVGKMAKPMADPNRAARGVGIAGGLAGLMVGGGPGAVIGAMLGARYGHTQAQLANGLQLLNMSSTRNLAFDGYRMMADMGNPGDVANVYRDEISAGRQLDTILARSQVEEINRLRFDPRRWKNYFPDDPGYEEMWQSVVNHQFGNSTLSRMMWNDALEDDDIVDWLTLSSEGRKTLRAMPKERRENPDEWIAEARRFMHQNLLPGEAGAGLRERLASGGNINFSEVKRVYGDNWNRQLGSVHGMEVIQITDTGTELRRFARKKIERAMEHLGKTPTDTLSRQPFFAHQYRQHLERSIAMLHDDTTRLSTKELRAMEDQARRIALKDTRNLLYDLAEESQFAQVVRFMMPFYNAWQEVITRYAGIAVDNPLYASRLYRAYQGVDNIGQTYTDDYGNTVQRIRLPAWAKGLVNVGIFQSAIDDQGYIAFNKQQLSMLGEAMPGFGPIVNVAVSQLARDRPELEESLRFMFPYGLASPGEMGVIEQFLPTAARHAIAGISENDAFQSTRARIALNAITAAEVAGQPLDLSDPTKVKEFYAEVTRQTKAFYSMRSVAAMTLPLSPQWQSPYQDYISAWQKLRLEDPKNAEQRFLEQYGEEYFALTQSLTKTYDGVPATIVGERVRDQYDELIEAYPEFGSLIIGAEGGGVGVQFSRAIYDKQRHEPISQGNPQMRRARLPLQEVITSPDARLGWQKWRRFSDWKIEQMDRLGIKSLRQKGGEALSAVQDVMEMAIARAHPEWYREFVDRDEAKWLRRIDAFEAITNTTHEGLRNRPDIAGLRQYLDMRRQIEGELVRRKDSGGSANLQASANRDLQLAWEVFQTTLMERSTAFSDLHARWLNGDMIDQNTFRTTVG